MKLQTPLFSLEPHQGGWRYRLKDGASFDLAPPRFEIDGRDVEARAKAWQPAAPVQRLANGTDEYRLQAALPLKGLSLALRLRVAQDSPIVRLQYTLQSSVPRKLTKRQGADRLRYLGFKAPKGWATEIRLSEWLPSVHSFCLQELPVEARHFKTRQKLFGPIVAAGDGKHTVLAAYEHGSTVPDAFLQFQLSPSRGVELEAVKGNYLRGQVLAPGEDFSTVWLQFGALPGGLDAMAAAYRHFVLHRFSLSPASRTPQVYYNTWNYQERLTQAGQHFNRDMNLKRMLKEADAAAKLGIDVFVVDTGWFVGSGDWEVHPKRFPDGMQKLRKKLEDKGLKLGVWFSPEWASLQSRTLAAHRDCIATQSGKAGKPWANWDSQPAQKLCFASRYWEAFADRLIALHYELGITNFKWDAVGQYGCDDPGHFHGGPDLSAQERAEAYSFQVPLRLAQVVERLQIACPDAVVDFDVTETRRAVGLAFLSVGRYFLFNNGPYHQDFDAAVPPGKTWNLFFNPGPARGWMSRAPLRYDRWLPGSSMMWHQLPDDPPASEAMNLATLALGPGGLWGDLPAIKKPKVARIAAFMRRYKKVRQAVTEASPVVTGRVGGSLEVYEKISARGRGAVMIFASESGTYNYVMTATPRGKAWLSPGLRLRRQAGQLLLSAAFKAGEYAKTAFFGV